MDTAVCTPFHCPMWYLSYNLRLISPYFSLKSRVFIRLYDFHSFFLELIANKNWNFQALKKTGMKPELKIESFHEPLTLCLIVWTAIEQDFTMFEMKFQVLRVESWNSMRANFVMKKQQQQQQQQQQLWAEGSLEFFVRSLRHSFSPYNFVYFWTRRQQFMSGHKQRFHIQFVLWGSLHSLNFSRLCKLMLTRNFSPICWLHNFELRQDFEVTFKLPCIWTK